ncbi:MAG: HDOD domain-containing protein [Acidimicrobiia bacterium]
MSTAILKIVPVRPTNQGERAGMEVRMTYVDELQTLPALPLSALRILEMIEDPNTSTADLARVVETDPILSAQAMRLANSAYNGMDGAVSSAGRAVVLLGFTTVRALATAAVCGLIGSHQDNVQRGFWPHAIAVALGASVVARRTAVPPGDAFSAGLVHDLGALLLQRRHGDAYKRVVDLSVRDNAGLLSREWKAFGTTHTEVTAEVLRDFNLPAAFVRAMEDHHVPLAQATQPLTKVLIAGEALAREFENVAPHEPVAPLRAVLGEVGLERVAHKELLDEMRREALVLGRFLKIQ